jgi:hypothetical protein
VSGSDWRELKRHRDDIRLAETAALLHDMGKCTSEFAYIEQTRSVGEREPYKAVFRADELNAYTFSRERIQERLDEANEQYAFHCLIGPKQLGKLDVSFTLDSHPYTLREAVYFSRPRFATYIGKTIGRPGHPLDLLAFCHGAAHAEKEDPHPAITPTPPAIYSAFGFQLLTLPGPGQPENLTGRLVSLDLEAVIRRFEKAPLKDLFRDALGDTRCPINEVNLWDWSYAVASLYKSELARHLLTGEWRRRDQLRWRLLRINFDVLGLYSRAIKLADLLGYISAVDKACERVKHLVEDEYPLGNEVYRDTTGIYFTFPDLDLPAELVHELRRQVEEVEAELAPHIQVGTGRGKDASEQLKRLLADQRSEARRELLSPFAPDNLSSCWKTLWDDLPEGKWEVCPVCRLRHKDEEDEVCDHCENRRKSRIEAWDSEPEQTVWLDELADENGRLALIVGKFGLDDWLSGDLVQTLLVKCDPSTNTFRSKNPSPARLRRVWETCQRFWEGTVSDIFSGLPDRARWKLLPADPTDVRKLPKGIVCDGTLAGQPISVFRIGDHLLTVSFCPEKPNSGTLRVSWEKGKGKQREQIEIRDAAKPSGDLAKYANYRPALTLLTSPDQFLALAPAGNALDLASKIHNAYAREHGKVQNRLPLFLGLVFFKRKTPLFAAMDTARRMVNQVEFREEIWKITSIQNDEIAFDNGYSWNVPTRMADGSDDPWYPYLFVEGNASHFSRAFRCAEGKYKSRWLVHVSELAGSAVIVIPSRFAYLFLEHTAQRFEFEPDKHVMYLDELPRLVAMWDAICKTKEMTDTKLRAVADLLYIKRQIWDARSDEFQRLVETTLTEAGLWEGGEKGAIAPDDVTSGRFDRCLEIYLRILKQRVKEERHEQHASVTL